MSGLTDIPGIRVGHATDAQNLTGCTAILCEEGAVAGGDIRGSATGTEEWGLLGNMVLLFLFLLVIARGMVITANAPSLFTRLFGGALTLLALLDGIDAAGHQLAAAGRLGPGLRQGDGR